MYYVLCTMYYVLCTMYVFIFRSNSVILGELGELGELLKIVQKYVVKTTK